MLVCVVGTDSQKWTLSRRFFMVDNMLSTGTDTSGTEYEIFKLKISYILVYQIIEWKISYDIFPNRTKICVHFQ